ncbi:MAG: WYL domain-containing protein [Lachnospiraceae bacterium]|nr:WYL domain-containing protein [Lachnospiraceae bacterium]
MYATGTKKMLNMLILDILKEYSDEKHRLTQQEIIRLLKANYEMECDRRSVKNNVESLKEMGYEISMEDGYYLMEREFDDAELRMLIDSVLFSKSLTQKQAKNLIDKLRAQGNRYFSAKVAHVSNLPEMQHGDNKLMYALDKINDAIAEKKKISFIYNSYGKDFKLHPKKETAYIVNPYELVANNGRFYLICNSDNHYDLAHYRLDKMTRVEILEEKVRPKKEIREFADGYSLPKHMAEHIYMFSGASVRVKLLVPDGWMNELIDWFGKDFRIQPSSKEGMMEVVVQCNEKAMLCWALQYGQYVEVMEPMGLREKVRKAVSDMYEKYNE